MHTTTDVAPSPQLLSFAERHVAHTTLHTPEIERRSEPREFFVSPAVVQRVDREFKPLGAPMAAVTRDLSLDGVGLIFEELPKHDLLAVRFAVNGQPCSLVVRTLWHRPLGPFEHVGCHVERVHSV